MIYLDESERVLRLSDQRAFFGGEISTSAPVAARALAMQGLVDDFHRLLNTLSADRRLDGNKLLEELWEKFTAEVDYQNGRNVPLPDGLSAEPTPSEPATAAATSTPSPSRSKKKG